MNGLLYLLFFISGFSALVYQVIWVRVLGNVFGNTIHSAAVVVAVFMLGLGVGSFAAGGWTDRRYQSRPDSLLRSYGYVELAVAALGLGLSLLLPQLAQLAAQISAYSMDERGWYVLSAGSHLARTAIAITLLTPITMLMGATLTLLIRHRVRHEVDTSGSRIAMLYAVNTGGAALGCFLTDFAFVPAYGLRATQFIAVLLNLAASAGALVMATRLPSSGERSPARKSKTGSRGSRKQEPLVARPHADSTPAIPRSVFAVGVALALSGFAAMGMEILWFRHFTILLGQFRAVFSLLLTIILLGIGTGALASGVLVRRVAQPAVLFAVTQALFVAACLFGLYLADAAPIEAAVRADPAALASMVTMDSGWRRTLAELWFNARPMLFEVAPAAVLMGFSFPLGNAIVQRVEHSVGRRAGFLYLANTAGAVAGSLVTGLLLLPMLGVQTSATVLMMMAACVIAPLYFGSRSESRIPSRQVAFTASSSLFAIVALAVWLTLPATHVIERALARPVTEERVLALVEGLNEVVAVTEMPAMGKRLLTNGHPMSSTLPTAQRYMRALAHIPLLSMDGPRSALIIGFGVGNTTHAASLHPTMQRIDVADLSKDVLAAAGYFSDANGNVLEDPRVSVFVNDGRQHLQIVAPESYDLITLEPPPIAYAGVAALYSRDFYSLARTRLKPEGIVSQWLPAYQVPTSTTLAMIRAFIDVFPNAVLLSGAESELLLLGRNSGRNEIEPDRLVNALSRAPAVQEDLRRIDLGSATEIVGTFVGSARTLAEATRDVQAVTDDHPSQEYDVLSLLNFGQAVPASVIDLTDIAAWCPTCFTGGAPAAAVRGLDVYLALLRQAYAASPEAVRHTRALAPPQGRVVAGSRYLGSIVPESAELHNVLALSLASTGNMEAAIKEFREALRLEPDSAVTHWHLGAALASQGSRHEALDHLRQSIALDPANEAAHNDIGAMLIREGRLDEAIGHFERALALNPAFTDARANLDVAMRAREQRRSN
jgi:predicted membrane-bound spermidine synthase